MVAMLIIGIEEYNLKMTIKDENDIFISSMVVVLTASAIYLDKMMSYYKSRLNKRSKQNKI